MIFNHYYNLNSKEELLRLVEKHLVCSRKIFIIIFKELKEKSSVGLEMHSYYHKKFQHDVCWQKKRIAKFEEWLKNS